MSNLPEAWRGQLPESWRWVPLRYVAKIGTGHTPDRTKPEYWMDCTIPWVTAADLSKRSSEFEPLTQTEQHVSQLGVAHSAAVVHPTGTVMFCRTASVGLLAITGRDMATTQAFVTWTAGPQLVARYLLYVLAAMRPELFRLAYGSTHLTIYMPDLAALRIPLPPLEEQRRIVDYLDEKVALLDRAISLRQRQVDLSRERLRAVIENRVRGLDGAPGTDVGDWLGVIASGWGTTTIGRSATLHAGAGFPPDEQGAEAGDIPFLKVSDLASRDSLGWLNRANNYVSRDTAARLRASVVPAGTVVFAKVGAALLTNHRTLLGTAATFDNNVMGLHPRKGDPRYWRYLLLCLDLGQMVNPGPVPSVNGSQIRAVRVPDIPDSVQRDIADHLDTEAARAASLESLFRRSLDLLRERKRAFIAAGVSGGLDVTTAQGVDRCLT